MEHTLIATFGFTSTNSTHNLYSMTVYLIIIELLKQIM